MFPHLHLVLIEVNHKKVDFLHMMIELLGFTDIEVTDLDWRTFLRKTDYPVEYCRQGFFARGRVAAYVQAFESL